MHSQPSSQFVARAGGGGSAPLLSIRLQCGNRTRIDKPCNQMLQGELEGLSEPEKGRNRKSLTSLDSRELREVKAVLRYKISIRDVPFFAEFFDSFSQSPSERLVIVSHHMPLQNLIGALHQKRAPLTG